MFFSGFLLSFVLTWLALNIAVNIINIWWVRYHYSHDRITIVWSLWHHQQWIVTSSAKHNQASEARGRCVKLFFSYSFMDSLCHVRNKIMYVLSWRTVSALTRVLFWYLFPLLLCNSGNKHQNNPLVSAEMICHSSTYIILCIFSDVIKPSECVVALGSINWSL